MSRNSFNGDLVPTGSGGTICLGMDSAYTTGTEARYTGPRTEMQDDQTGSLQSTITSLDGYGPAPLDEQSLELEVNRGCFTIVEYNY